MNLTPDFVQGVRNAMKEYDSAKDMETRIAAGQRLDESVSELSESRVAKKELAEALAHDLHVMLEGGDK